ncbi:MAG TPA: transketolase C-terminal domain-containing protein [bacterium]|nr:transketolase C-terminal domain-containing protein [bacterium]
MKNRMEVGKNIGIEISIAQAEVVAQCDVDVISAYPITPQTHIVEHLAEIVNDGDLDAAFIPVESEHSAMSACCGSSAVGARTFTATSSQGLALMHEILYIASGLRLPIVMSCVNRSLSAPISIWGDQGDIMAERDTGWVQIFTETGQEVIDQTICSFKIAEDPRVMLPTIVNMDGFQMSHVIEPMKFYDTKKIQDFLGIYQPPLRLDPADPIMMGPVGIPEIYTEAKMAHDVALVNSQAVIEEVWEKFAAEFGNKYNAIEHYKTDDADYVIVTVGGYGQNASVAIDKLREKGIKAGQIKLRLWRPFPHSLIQEALESRKGVFVFDRCLSVAGPGGPIASEIKTSLYNLKKRPAVVSYVGGLSGRDFTVKQFVDIFEKGIGYVQKDEAPIYEMVGVRE